MYSGEANSVWSKKGGTLSDKFARKKFGLSQEEIIKAILLRPLMMVSYSTAIIMYSETHI